jgi:hypothetical protein
MWSGMLNLQKMLTSQEILSYRATHNKWYLREEKCFEARNRDLFPNYRFWTDKAEDAA